MTMQLFRARALQIKRTLGTKPAAAYLRNRGISLQSALVILAY